MADLQSAIQALLDELVESGEEVGLQAAVYVNGKLVVDCVAGWRSQARDARVADDTLFTIYSATKGVVGSAVHMLAERELIDYDRPVAEYWPEFAAGGKESITVIQALNHVAGIPQAVRVEGMTTGQIWADLDRSLAEVARLEPIFAPGSTACYHGLTIGWIAEGIVRGVGRNLGELVADEIVEPLGMQDEMYLGTPVTEHDRMATPFDKPLTGEPPELDPLVLQCVPLDEPIAEILNRPHVRAAQIPAANISATARALARHYAALVGEVDGCRLVSAAHLERVLAQRTDLPDAMFQLISAIPQETPRAGAYQLNTGKKQHHMYYGPNLEAFGHDGYGGCFGCADPAANIALGLTKTLLHSGIPARFDTLTKPKFVETVYGNL